MDMGECKTTQEATDYLNRLRTFKPYQYGGKWFVGVSKGIGVAYRAKAALIARVKKDTPEIQVIEIATYG